MADMVGRREAALLDAPALTAAGSVVDLAELLELPADPLAWLHPDVLFAVDPHDSAGQVDADRVDARDLDTPVPSWVEAEHEFAGVAASVDAFAELCTRLDAAEQAQFTVNRAMAEHLAAVRAALDIAARNPAVYLQPAALGKPDSVDLAVRSAATELSMRLHLPVGTIRNRAYEATVLHDRLPQVWARFTDGAVTYDDARVAVMTAAGFPTGDARLAELDAALAAVIGTVTTARFRQRARTVRTRLERELAQARHARAFAERRVVVEHVDDGMAWLHLYTSQVEAAKIGARLDATARRDAGHPDQTRTIDQLRADTATAWLTGAGTPTAARTEIIVTIPVLTLTSSGSGKADQPHAGGVAGGKHPTLTAARAQTPMLDGIGPIDDATARQLFADAHSFRRLAVDPITAAPLTLDRTRYRVTKDQRLWLALVHGRCSRPGCNRLAYTADIDHNEQWARGGRTNPENLCPACRGDHRLKHTTRFTPTKNPDHTTTWRSPTGREYTDPPPF